MTIDKENIEIISPKNQLNLFGYESYFNLFAKLFSKNKLPNTILLTGLKGSGKSTFAYHFINYLLSNNEEKKYSVENFTINFDNKSYKLIDKKIHPNVQVIESNNEENIKIEEVKNTLKFLSKSSYNSNIKIVLIDNAEYLNLHSSNALLKSLEEPNNNTFFFIIHNSSCAISNTLKSRCVEFKVFFSLDKKKEILKKIVEANNYNLDINSFEDNFYLDSPGSTLKYLEIFKNLEPESSNDRLSCISFLIEKYKKKKDSHLLIFISLLIEYFYNDLSLKNYKKLNIYFYNKFKALKLINEVKKFNLDKNNLFISIQDILKNES